MTKSDLRKRYLERRLALTDEDYAHFNQRLCETFFLSVDLSFVRVLHTFLPIRKYNEPDTGLIVGGILKSFPLIRISIPKVNDENGTLENYFWEGPDQLVQNKWGLIEPGHGVPTPTDKIDMVLVPLAAVDVDGNRVGYGKGYYDKFLKDCRPDCLKVGLSFFGPAEKFTDVEEHDVPLNICITPTTIYTFGSS
jgi:5-formyltetrahydrofolate cyclo-ligase